LPVNSGSLTGSLSGGEGKREYEDVGEAAYRQGKRAVHQLLRDVMASQERGKKSEPEVIPPTPVLDRRQVDGGGELWGCSRKKGGMSSRPERGDRRKYYNRRGERRRKRKKTLISCLLKGAYTFVKREEVPLKNGRTSWPEYKKRDVVVDGIFNLLSHQKKEEKGSG